MVSVSAFRNSALRTPHSALFLFAIACALAVCAASWRHTGSLAFPIDDGYIYSNYVLSASQGEAFVYNSGQSSGGITGLGWFALCVAAYWLLAPLHGLLGGLAPIEVQAVSQGLAQQAGHLYLAAYLPGVLCLALTAVGVYRLAQLSLPEAVRNTRARDLVCVSLGMIAAADLGLVWGALSGLEVALSSALAVWAVALLLSDVRRGWLRWSLLPIALLPWARPDLLAISAACGLWLLVRALSSSRSERGIGIRNIFTYAGAVAGGLAMMCAIYYAGWGQPLPSSFYAKVGGLRSGAKVLSAIQELMIAGRALPFVAAGLALMGGLVGLLPSSRRPVASGRGEDTASANGARHEARWAALLLLMVSTFYVLALMLTLPWFGQEDRYLLPLHPFLIVLVGMLIWRIVGLFPVDRLLAIPGFRPIVLLGAALILVGGDYIWATREYAVEVRNIRDAHVLPALWIAANTPPDSVIASEPIGAVRLFSGRRTVDLVGLTTPATLGTYRDWPRAWPALRSAGATHLFFYPAWFDEGEPPPWAVELQQFSILDNRIAGSDVIAVYRLDWAQFSGTR
ncbi:MAG: hypothetical protein WCD37_13270 [Chloroflexia bacterium]